MSVRLIALDLDGTLTNDQKQITDYTKEILREVSGRGVKIALASGRPTLGILPVARELGLDKTGGYVIAFNGGHILDLGTGKDVFRASFPREYIRTAAEYAAKNRVPIISYDEENILTEGPVDEYVLHEVTNTGAQVRLVPDLPAHLTFPIVKMLICGNPDKLASMEGPMAETFRGILDIYRAEPWFLEVMPRGINKSQGLRTLADYLDLTRDEIMACGDANNDIPMLRQARYSIAMANAVEGTKREAAFITRSNNEDGVAYAIRKFVLDGEELPEKTE